jgi:uncharacterized protein (DUF1800 family)
VGIGRGASITERRVVVASLQRINRKSNQIVNLWRDLVQETVMCSYPITGIARVMDALAEMDVELKSQIATLIEPPDGWEPGGYNLIPTLEPWDLIT